jgi:hypothetical protein
MGTSLKAYIKHRGVTFKAVQKVIARKRIKLESDGTVDSAGADRDWAANGEVAANFPGVISRRP